MLNYIIAHTGEDGAFYLQIAQHIAHGEGVTFDGIHPTTGVHWGWVLLLAGWLRVFGDGFGPAAAVYIGLLFIAAGLTAVLVGGRHGILAALFLVLLLGSRGQWLMENHLVMVLLASTYLAVSKTTMMGLLVPLGFALVVARLDLIILIAGMTIACNNLRLLIGGVMGVAFSFLLNWYIDGHFLSVSGVIKAGYGWNDWGAIWDNVRLFNEYYFPVLQLTTIGAIIYAIRTRDRMLVSALAACMFMVALYIAKDRAPGGWYLAPMLLTTLVMATRMVGDTHWPYEGFVEPIKAATKPTDRIWMEDLSGKLALGTGRRFISGDGLVNSFDYIDYLKSGRIGDYVKQYADYFLSSNIRCDESSDRPWIRYVDFDGQWYKFIIDVSYLTNMPLKPSIVVFDKSQLIFDICDRGYRELLFKVK